MSLDVKASTLFTAAEAAEKLKVSTHTITNMAKNGLIGPVFKRDPHTGRNTMYFHPAEVYALAATELSDLGLSKVANMACRALAIAQHNQREMDAILELLGIHREVIPFDKEGIVALLEKVRFLVTEQETFTESDALFWAKVFTQTTEEYLRLLSTEAGEPWTALLALGEKIANSIRCQPSLTSDKVLSYLNAARRHLRNTAFFYVRTLEGFSGAKKKGLNYDRLDDEIIRLMSLV